LLLNAQLIFPARLDASLYTAHMPCPINGGIKCAASPAIKILPFSPLSALAEWKNLNCFFFQKKPPFS
jgi:hypothetical protein